MAKVATLIVSKCYCLKALFGKDKNIFAFVQVSQGERKEKRGLISILSGWLTQGGEIRYFRGPWFTTGPINLDMCVTVFSVKWHRDTARKFQNSVCVTDVTLFALMIGHKTSRGTLTLLSITLFPHISVVVLSHLFPFCSKSNRSQHYWKKKGNGR